MNWLFLLIPLFSPPDKWEIADPQMLGKQVEIGFVTKGKKGLCPSLNLATEDTDLNLEQYIQVVRSLHAKKGELRDLGSFSVSAGTGRLLQLDTLSKFGTVRLLQFICVSENKAYALTAAAAKEEFPSYMPVFEKALKSFKLIDHVSSVLGEEKWENLRTSWKKSQSHIKSRKAIEKYILKDCAEYGSYFQVLLFKELAKENKE